MATTTATITLSSGDLTGDALALSQTATLTKAGTLTGLSETTGVGRKTTGATATIALFEAADYDDDKAHKVYIKNTSSTATEYFTIGYGATATVGRLYSGDWAFMPWNGDLDFNVTPSVPTNMTVEYMLIFE